jgi:hypothetical protein
MHITHHHRSPIQPHIPLALSTPLKRNLVPRLGI